MPTIGTAGHVDHGKSALVEALTGTHPDRLREEQERGLTIELGFAWCTLRSGRNVSIVDVPGHVRFVRHMLAGAGAIDLALFVVAADEGVMPQTREHLEILDLLNIRHGVVALTKCDLVDDPDWLDLVEEEVRLLLEPTSLAGSPIVRVSAQTGAGLDELRAALDIALDATPAARDIGRPRLGIDRVFTMPGFGTVVTGTLLDGRLHVGDTLEAVPGGPTARVRGLQSHRLETAEALPGTRTAVNLAGVDRDQLCRGQVLAPPGRIQAARSIDARVRVLDHRPLRHNLRVALHIGSDEVQARVRVLGRIDDTSNAGRAQGLAQSLLPTHHEPVEEGARSTSSTTLDALPPQTEGWVQLVLTEPVAAIPGELFVLRVSDETIAGGRVVEVNAPRHRRTDRRTIERLAARAAGTPESRLLAALERLEPCLPAALRTQVELDTTAFEAALVALVAGGDARSLEGGLLISAAGLARLHDRALRALQAYHAAHPLRVTMPREELRAPLALEQREYSALLSAVVEAGGPAAIEERAGGLAAAGWQPQPTAAQRRAAVEAVSALEAGGAAPPRLDLDLELLAYLAGTGRVVDCGDGVVLAAPAFEAAIRATIEALRGADGAPRSATLAELRDALGTNRRAAQAILETMDRLGVTHREGEGRVLGPAATPTSGERPVR
ncbi:MAG: selenocysteine-specific translation elongation factor [Dehalococcoidia bacterium]|nr:selenocysteine-specific translation elongation factor [Dehalococcoidia bacterium]